MGAGVGKVSWTSGAINATSTTAHGAKQYQKKGLKTIPCVKSCIKIGGHNFKFLSTNAVVTLKLIGTSLENGMRNYLKIDVWKFAA